MGKNRSLLSAYRCFFAGFAAPGAEFIRSCGGRREHFETPAGSKSRDNARQIWASLEKIL